SNRPQGQRHSCDHCCGTAASPAPLITWGPTIALLASRVRLLPAGYSCPRSLKAKIIRSGGDELRACACFGIHRAAVHSKGKPMKNSWSMTVGRATLLALMIAGAASACRASDDQGASTTACDRACLNGLVDQYLDAVVAHEPSRLPATTFVKFTEDGQHLTLGDGLWRTATGKGTYKFYIDDPDAGQVGFVGTMREAGQPVILALRLKIENQKISEIETILGRGQMAQGGAAN